MFVHEVKTRHDVKKVRHDLKDMQWRQKVRYNITFSLYFIHKIMKQNISKQQKAGNVVRNTSWQHKVRHDVKNTP